MKEKEGGSEGRVYSAKERKSKKKKSLAGFFLLSSGVFVSTHGHVMSAMSRHVCVCVCA